MCESAMFELVDFKAEIYHPGFEEGAAYINNVKPDSVHRKQKQLEDIEFNFQQCDQNCETCQKYIRKLREHVRATHGVGGQSTCDPIRLEVPYVDDSTLSNLEIKGEVEADDTMDCELATEMMLETGETNESESDSDKTTTETQKTVCQKLESRESYSNEDPLKADTVERNKLESGHKPFQCDECGKRYGTKSHLIGHKRTHTDERPYKCDECDKRFFRSNHLTQHKRTHTGERPFRCDECDGTFISNNQLTEHVRIHTGKRPYECDECDFCFTRADILSRHKKIHSGQGPYKCDVCEKTFSRSDKLTRHKGIHSGVRPHKCDECEKTFGRSSDLTRHRRSHKK